MKKLLLFISAFAFINANTNAQNAIPNPGFENWTNQGNYKDPVSWGTINGSVAGACFCAGTCRQATSVHSGSFAAELKTISVFGQTAPGIAATGTINTQTQAVDGGVAFNLRPDSIKGWYKYTPQGTDTASVEIILSKWNGSARDQVGSAKWIKTTAVSSYTEFAKAIAYSLTIDPDTMVIVLLSSHTNLNSSNVNSDFFVDDLSLTFPPVPPTLTTSVTNVSCNGGNNGAVNLTVSGGTSPYTFLWSNNATTEDISGLLTGTYTVTVTDAASQTATASATVSQPTALGVGTASNTGVSCNGGSNGAATITGVGGTSPYTYLWNNGQTSSTATGLSAGNYTVTITDANGCTLAGVQAIITEPTAIVLSLSSTNETSNGANDGTAGVSASGGASGYTYLWSNGATTASISNLAPNSYTVTVTDASGCTMTGSTSVNGVGCSLTASATSQNEICGQTNGMATASATGNSPLTHTITVASFSFTPNSVNAAVGDTIKWVWSNGSHTTTSTTIPNGAAAWDSPMNTNSTVFKYVVTQVGTYNYVCTPHSPNMSGVINVTDPVFTYLWSNGATTAAATGLAAGNYSVTVTDAANCSDITNVTIGNNPGPSATVLSTVPTLCNGSTDGAVDLSVTGGTSPYIYLWNNSFSTEDLTGVGAGNYSVTVTDNSNCSTTTFATVSEPAALNITVGSTDASCGNNNGSATASGGVSYQWSANANNQTNATATGLAAGNYSVTVTNGNGCTGTASVNVSNTGGPTASVTTTVDSTGNSGTATVVANGGTSPYTYSWSNSQTGATATGLSGGTYNVTVTDGANCQIVVTATVQSTAGINSIQITESFQVYPNPNNGNFMVWITNQSVSTDGKIIIYNVLGKIVYQSRITRSPVLIDLSENADGIYFVNVSGTSKTMTKMIVLNRE